MSGFDFEKLSSRERQIIDHIINGGTRDRIASDLSIARSTINTHLTNIRTKLIADDQDVTNLQLFIAYDRWSRNEGWPKVEHRRALKDRRRYNRRKDD